MVDPAANRIAAYPNSSTVNTTSARATNRGITVFQGSPLRTPAGLAINPLNGDLLVVNQADNNLVEIRPSPVSKGAAVVAVRPLDSARVNPHTGAGSALFGLAATTDAAGNLKVYFSDDNTNTLNALVAASPPSGGVGGSQGGHGPQGTPSPTTTPAPAPMATSTPGLAPTPAPTPHRPAATITGWGIGKAHPHRRRKRRL